MLHVKNLSCTRGERLLFSDITIAVGAGDCLHVRGTNGSGKTTLLRTLVGLSPVETGEISWRGVAIADSAMNSELIYLGHHAAVNGDLTAFENLCFANAQDGIAIEPKKALDALQRLGLSGREELPVRVLSAGQKRRVLLARLLTREAKLWVLDEAFNTLDVGAANLLNELIADHLQGGGVAVLTSHQPLAMAGVEVLDL
jgi:heme exporter protein A